MAWGPHAGRADRGVVVVILSFIDISFLVAVASFVVLRTSGLASVDESIRTG